MKYKLILYVIDLFLSVYALSSVDFDKFIKSKKPIEARVLVLLLAFALSYLVTNFITDFIS